MCKKDKSVRLKKVLSREGTGPARHVRRQNIICPGVHKVAQAKSADAPVLPEIAVHP